MALVHCGVGYFCLGSLLLLIGSILLCTLGFTVLLPYTATSDWPEANCSVYSSGYNITLCSCRSHEFSALDCLKFPCLQVMVNYNLSGSQNGMLYRTWNDAFHGQCSLYECADEEWNRKEVKGFEVNWGQLNQKFPCYYDPSDVTKIVLNRPTDSEVLHAVLWPTVTLTVGLMIWLCMCIGCWEVRGKDGDQSTEKLA